MNIQVEEHALLYNINMLYTNAFVKYNFNIFFWKKEPMPKCPGTTEDHVALQ